MPTYSSAVTKSWLRCAACARWERSTQLRVANVFLAVSSLDRSRKQHVMNATEVNAAPESKTMEQVGEPPKGGLQARYSSDDTLRAKKPARKPVMRPLKVEPMTMVWICSCTSGP